MNSPSTEAVLLGIVQGWGEFLPLSGAGHRALAEILFKLHGGAGYGLLLRVATLVTTLLVLWPETARAVRDGVRALVRPSRFNETTGGRDALVVLLASVPSALIGLALRAPVERFTGNPLAIGLGFLGTTAALSLAHFAGPGEREQPTLRGALLMGVAQGLGVLPGLSRIGATLSVALLLGVRPARAFELSLLVSLPVLVGSIVLEARESWTTPAPGLFGVVAAVVATGTGVSAAGVLRALVNRGYFAWFAFWVGPLALATMAMGLAWPA